VFNNKEARGHCMKKIALEEHYLLNSIPHELFEISGGAVAGTRKAYMADLESKLPDLAEGRLKEMEDTGIDIEILSPGALYDDQLSASDGLALAKKLNDGLCAAINKYPKRFAGLASLSLIDLKGAADELERGVKQLGLKGGQICSNFKGEYIDNQKYWVLFERAEELGVPIYIHPAKPSQDISKPLMTYPGLSGSMFGFAMDSSLNALRMIFSGVFDRYPNLKIILGHLGEALPFWMWRIDQRFQKEGNEVVGKLIKKNPGAYIRENIFITTSGMFYQPALLCSYLALGADRILFAVDYPMESNKEAVDFINTAPLCDMDKEKICHLNAEKLLAL
jgi:predicted TIM-barrel fold metal-dependent hydrolase